MIISIISKHIGLGYFFLGGISHFCPYLMIVIAQNESTSLGGQ